MVVQADLACLQPAGGNVISRHEANRIETPLDLTLHATQKISNSLQ